MRSLIACIFISACMSVWSDSQTTSVHTAGSISPDSVPAYTTLYF